MDNSMDIEMWDCVIVCAVMADGEQENEQILLVLRMWIAEAEIKTHM